MRNQPSPDDAIDQALAVLRNARAAEGLEARILASLRHPEPAGLPTRGWFPATLTLATASLLAAALFFRGSAHPPTVEPVHLPNPRPTRVTATQLPCLPFVQRRATAPRQRLLSRPTAAELTSFPAPAAPLTQEERLLLRIAHRGDQEGFDLLNPEAVARELAQNMAEFDHFFPPPPPFGPPAPKPSTETPKPNQETPNEAHPMDR